jgi:hypothetical protein
MTTFLPDYKEYFTDLELEIAEEQRLIFSSATCSVKTPKRGKQSS